MSLPALQSDSVAGTAIWLNHVMVHVSGASDGSGDGYWSYDSTALNRIKYTSSTQTWSDIIETSSAPNSLSSTSTHVSNQKDIVNPETVFMWYNNGDFLGKFDNPFYVTTASSGMSFSGSLSVVGTTLEYSIPAHSSAGTYQLMSSASSTAQLDIVHGSSLSSGSAPNFDQTKIWTLLSPYGDELDKIDLNKKKKVFSNFW